MMRGASRPDSSLDDLFRRAKAGTHGCVYGSPVAGSVRVLAGEEKSLLNWLREDVRSIEASGGDVTIRAE